MIYGYAAWYNLFLPKAYIIARRAVSYRRYIIRDHRERISSKKSLLSIGKRDFFLAPPVGLEPTTLRLTAACSTDWAKEEYLRPSSGLFGTGSIVQQLFQKCNTQNNIFGAERWENMICGKNITKKPRDDGDFDYFSLAMERTAWYNAIRWMQLLWRVGVFPSFHFERSCVNQRTEENDENYGYRIWNR